MYKPILVIYMYTIIGVIIVCKLTTNLIFCTFWWGGGPPPRCVRGPYLSYRFSPDYVQNYKQAWLHTINKLHGLVTSPRHNFMHNCTSTFKAQWKKIATSCFNKEQWNFYVLHTVHIFAFHILRLLIFMIEFDQHLKHALLTHSLKTTPWCRNM
jgi:hypothetical protein